MLGNNLQSSSSTSNRINFKLEAAHYQGCRCTKWHPHLQHQPQVHASDAHMHARSDPPVCVACGLRAELLAGQRPLKDTRAEEDSYKLIKFHRTRHN